MRVAKVLVFAYTNEDWEVAKGILESKGHKAFRGKTVVDLVQFTCMWGNCTREDRCLVDGVLVVGRPGIDIEGVLPPPIVETVIILRNLRTSPAIFCAVVIKDGWAQEIQENIMTAEDCLEEGGELEW